jgi:hypothetical protein
MTADVLFVFVSMVSKQDHAALKIGIERENDEKRGERMN